MRPVGIERQDIFIGSQKRIAQKYDLWRKWACSKVDSSQGGKTGVQNMLDLIISSKEPISTKNHTHTSHQGE